MSRLKSHILQRGRVSLLATFMLLIAMVIAVPGVSSARAAVKQFTATISPTTATGQVAGSWTETVTNCGGTPLMQPCTAASTIGIGTIHIAVPTEFQSITSGPTVSDPNWTVSYDSATGTIKANALQGSNKLQPGQSLQIAFSATPTCVTGMKTFTTSAWGSNSAPGTDSFSIAPGGSQPAVTINGCQLGSGGSVTDPTTGQTETVSGDFTGFLIVTFGGNLACNGDPQWAAGYHLPTQVNITPGDGFHAGTHPKFSTSTFDGAGDSSFYRICYSRDPRATTGTILLPCYPGGGEAVIDPPCVDQQYRDFTTGKIVITIQIPATDPGKR
jgi:hypothetical protein